MGNKSFKMFSKLVMCMFLIFLICAGYKSTRIERLMEDVNPALALLTDWIISNGNTAMAVDLLTLYLQQLGREDVVQVIERAKGWIFINEKKLMIFRSSSVSIDMKVRGPSNETGIALVLLFGEKQCSQCLP